jgi:hypothetical protein
MKRWYFRKEPRFSLKGATGKTYKVFDSTGMHGYQAMQRAERYQEKYGGIEIVHIDDNAHAGSILILIPHKGMGITTIFVPQCTSESNIFFLYPDHVAGFSKALNKMNREVKCPIK